MPIYEYRCARCKRRFSVFWRTFSAIDEAHVTCRHCGSDEVGRLISRIRVMRSEDSRLENMTDPSQWGDFDENDPKSLGRFMRKMADEVGDEAGDLGPEFDEVVGRLEAGQDPEKIEKEMPDLLGGESADGTSAVGTGDFL